MQTLNNNPNSLYKVRSLGEALNDTFKFMRAHYVAIFVPLVVAVWPLRAAFSYLIMGHIKNLTNYEQVWTFMGYTLLYVIVSVIFTRLLTLGIVMYMKKINDTGVTPTLSEVINATLPKIPTALLTYIVAGLITGIGFVFLLIPGVYFAIIFSLLLPILVIETNTGISAINKCLDITKNKFWQTFGFMIIIGLISWSVSMAVTLPMTLFGLFKSVTGVRTNPFIGNGYSNVMTIPSMISELVSTLISGFTTVAVTIWYFSLAEEKYGIQAEQVLNNLQNNAPTGNEGDF